MQPDDQDPRAQRRIDSLIRHEEGRRHRIEREMAYRPRGAVPAGLINAAFYGDEPLQPQAPGRPRPQESEQSIRARVRIKVLSLNIQPRSLQTDQVAPDWCTPAFEAFLRLVDQPRSRSRQYIDLQGGLENFGLDAARAMLEQRLRREVDARSGATVIVSDSGRGNPPIGRAADDLERGNFSIHDALKR